MDYLACMSTPRPVISIVIPVWNNWELTADCLQSLALHGPDFPTQIILVDNGSTDATSSRAPLMGASLFGEAFVYLRWEDNRGFAKACNAGAAAASGMYVLFLNNDTVVTSGWLPPLLDAMKEDRQLAGVGPLLLFPDDGSVRSGRVQHLGIATTPAPDFLHLYELFPASHPVVRKRRSLRVITAAALLMPAGLFKARGGFFEGFVNGMEDVDLCCRIAMDKGRFSVIPDSVVYHRTHATAGRFDHDAQNLHLLLQRCRNIGEDMTRYLEEDGYEPHFTEWLSLTPGLPEARAKALDLEWGKEESPDTLIGVLEAEPLWDAGHARLAMLLSAAGRIEDAAAAAYLRSLLCPGIEAYEESIHYMNLCGNTGLAKRQAASLNAVRGMASDRESMTKAINTIRQRTANPLIMKALGKRLGE